jgi:hypothetical protein
MGQKHDIDPRKRAQTTTSTRRPVTPAQAGC